MSSETVLHRFKLFNTFHSFGLLLRVNKARERFPEVRSTRTVGHTSQALSKKTSEQGMKKEEKEEEKDKQGSPS